MKKPARRGLFGAICACPATLSAGTGAAGELTLGAAAAASGRDFGAALAPGPLTSGVIATPPPSKLICVTAEDEMKWECVEPLRGPVRLDGGGRDRRLRQGPWSDDSWS